MRVAAIDCGTNSVRLLIADLRGGALSELVREMRIVRLGEGVDRTGRLAPAAIERTRLALEEYAGLIKEHGADRVRMVATSASRDAENAGEFVAMVRSVLGIDPEVVSGDEEARLSFTGAVRGLETEGPYLVVDIGGGSTEFVVGDREVESAISVDIGCVRMTERHIHADPPSTVELADATADITATVERALGAVGGGRGLTLVGLAGSVTTIAGIWLGLTRYEPKSIHHAVVPAAGVADVVDRLIGMDHDTRLAIPIMHPGRADVIIAGGLILRTIMERTGAGAVIASESDILDGIAWGLSPDQ
ncbi:Ppx/GppA phosphatase family protein [Longispora albida]|uniref:Ppx/GppA phosphatase family protein n=1 Tax=Longispora albida TaxID=203523 RepID=UPI0003A95F02|nr:Ppx/GppA phosphatase family protein [Longispora albida]